VGAAGHERAVAERELPADAREKSEPGDGAEVGGDRGQLVVAEWVEHEGQPCEGRQDDDGDDERLGAGHAVRSFAREKIPPGRMSSTARSSTRTATGVRVAPR